MKKYFFSSLLILFILSACNFPFPAATLTPLETPGRSKPEASLTPTLPPTPTASLPPTVTPTVTYTLTPSFTPTPVCLQGSIEQQEITVEGLAKPLRFRIYLPPCYSDTPEKPYPVLYMLHGQTFNESQWDDLGMDEAADAMISSGEIQPLIIVMPGEDNYLQDAVSSKFGPALIQQLIPWVDEHYATCSQRACRALGGLSRGAAWAMRLGIMNAELFTALGGHSLALFDGDVNYLPLLFSQLEEDMRPKIYLDTGRDDRWRGSVDIFATKLEYLKADFQYKVQLGAHNVEYWQTHTPEYLRWYGEVLSQP